ncbi:hypothetical protein NPIL_148861 [Nephila pilipes]|uniref:Reverse transcriptase/retrotransposon-derived protein RNase H-like domain-containing protein n=1 Tax=Nephila pilipes TaxID=299642 RepID=A0A8X6PWX0_NEPPI|nr:hypothetical protein NPIL_148861 [Nephila pilipes]
MFRKTLHILSAAFNKSKQILANTAMLAPPTPNASLVLQVDASSNAMGGALNQMTATRLKPLAFFLKKLTNTQMKYNAYDRKLLAVYLTIKVTAVALAISLVTKDPPCSRG